MSHIPLLFHVGNNVCPPPPHVFDSARLYGNTNENATDIVLKSNEFFLAMGSNIPSTKNALSQCGSVMIIIIIIIIITIVYLPAA